MSTTKLYHNIIMKNFNTGEELFNATIQELADCEIIPFTPTGNGPIDQKNQLAYEKSLRENSDRLSKYTLANALNQLFDIIEMPSNSDFALYADTLKNIRIAKENNLEYIEITKEDIERLKKLFAKPPKNPQLNRIVAFVLECMDKVHIEALA